MLLLFIVSIYSQVITYDAPPKEKKIDYIYQSQDVLNRNKLFREQQAIVLIEIKFCLPLNIQYLIGNFTLFYKDIDTKHLTEGFLFTKLSKDLQNHKPFCNAIKDASNVFFKRMRYLLNYQYYRQDVAIERKEKVDEYDIYQRCLKLPLELPSNSDLFECLQKTERKALINASS
jgi:hypothetical protein